MAKKNADADEDIIDQINREFGSGTLILMDNAPSSQYKTISTGSIRLDLALGIGGLPRGRIVEIFGPESSGKTTIALHAIANAQAQGHRCAFIDAEHALDLNYARNLGVAPHLLALSQPDYGEQALDVCTRLVSSGKFAVIVVDSVAALTPKAELEGDMSDSHVGLQSRMMSMAMRKLVAAVNVSDTLLIFINQIRSKIGGYGNPETTSGGNALKFFASIRIRIVRTGSGESGGEKISNTTKAKVIKNKCAPPFREAEFEIEFGKGVSIEGELLDVAIEFGHVVKSGAWFSMKDGTRMGQGREGAKLWLSQHPEIMQTLVAEIRK